MSSSLENYDSTQAELSRLMERLTQNPATRKNVLREVKKLEPDLPIPELEIEDSLRNVTNHAEARVQQLEARLREKEALEELNRRRQALVKRARFLMKPKSRRSKRSCSKKVFRTMIQPRNTTSGCVSRLRRRQQRSTGTSWTRRRATHCSHSGRIRSRLREMRRPRLLWK